MRRHLSWLIALGLVAAFNAVAASTEDEAGDIAEVDKDALGPLRERIRPVTGHVLLKRHRFELAPSITLSIKDAFFTKYFIGAAATYHFSEFFALSGRFAYAPFKIVSGSAEICTPTSSVSTAVGCRPPTYDELNGQAPGQIMMMGGLDAQWAPIYGKIALVAESFVHFDLYGILGPAFIQYRGPTEVGVGSTVNSTFGGNVGVGTRFFLNRWLTIKAELRDLVYVEKVSPLPDSALRQQILFELGLSFFLPTKLGEAEK